LVLGLILAGEIAHGDFKCPPGYIKLSAAIPGEAGKNAKLATLYRLVIAPVLEEGGRTKYAGIKYEPATDTVTLASPMGEYRIRFTENPAEAYPHLGLPDISVSNGKVSSDIVLYAPEAYGNIARLQGVVRSALRADRYLHPHLSSPDGGKLTLSFPQREALAALISMEKNVKGKKGLKRGLIKPVGMGKTIVAAKYVDALGQYHREKGTKGWKKKPRVLFVVENNWILDRSVETFETELGFKKVSKLYGESVGETLDPNAEMIAITRSSNFSRINEILELMKKDPEQPWVVVFDEAQHLGSQQFQEIRNELDSVIDHRHRVLLLSATPWHPNQEIIADYLEGNVHGSLLSKEEQAQLRRGEKLPEIARIQYYRGMQQGYLSPLFGVNMVREVDGAKTADILGREVADKENQTRIITRYRSLLTDAVERISANQIPGLSDRGVFYVDTQEQANILARELSKQLGEEVRPLHAGAGVDPTTRDWFSDKGKFDNATNRKKTKYIVAVDMLKEGVDIPAINLIVLMRKYGDDMGGFRNLIQNIGRGSRNHSADSQIKPHLRLVDYSLYSRWFRDGLGEISVEPRETPGRKGRSAPKGYLVVDNEIYDPIHFQSDYFHLFPRDGSFLQEFPFYDPQAFKDGGLTLLHELAGSYGVIRFNEDFGVKQIILRLAGFLPESPEKNRLIEQLSDDAVWGWKAGDGGGSKFNANESDPAAQRIYRALYRIAALQKLTPEGGEIELTRLHERDELESLIDSLDPDRVKSLTLPEQRVRFLDKENGAWAALAGEAIERNLGKVSDRHGLETRMTALAGGLPESEREKMQARFKGDLAFGPIDGQAMNSTAFAEEQARTGGRRAKVRGPLQRGYRAFYAIAQVLKKTPAGANLDLSRLHDRTEAEKVLRLLNPDRTGVIFDSAKHASIWDPATGAIYALGDRAKSFGVTSFARDYAPMRLLIEFAKRLPESPERAALVADLGDKAKWGWVGKDGAILMNERYDNPTGRFYRALAKVAHLHNKLSPELPIDLEKIHERGEAEKLMNYLTLGFTFPSTSGEQALVFARNAGAVPEDRARAMGISAYVTNYGPKRVAILLTQKMEQRWPESPLPKRLIAALEDNTFWGWSSSDGHMVKVGSSEVSALRTQRAFLAVAALLEKLDPSYHADPATLSTEAGLTALLDRL